MAKLYLKIKQNGKWEWKPASTPYLQYNARSLCECISCNPKKEEEE